MKTAAAYLRVSTERQDEYSLDSQRKLIKEYAAAHNIEIPPEFVFVEDGVSGRSAQKRPAFQRMIAAAKARQFDVILVWKFSRFARNQEEAIVYKSMLARAGVDVVSISEPVDDSPFGSLIERIIEWMDEYYSIRLAGEVKRGMAERVARAEIVTIPSFGYRVQDKKYVPDENAGTVRRMFEDFADGKPLLTIAQELTAAGVRTRRGSIPTNRWVKYILRNPVYIGKLRWSREGKHDYYDPADREGAFLIDGGHEPLIDAETFRRVQERLDRRAAAPPYTRHEQPVEWMLKGLVRCSVCGATLVYSSTACPSMQCYQYAHGAHRGSQSLSIRKANAAVADALEQAAAFGSFPLAPRAAAADPSPDLEKQAAAIRTKLRRCMEAYEAGVDTLEEYARKKRRLTAELDDLHARQNAAPAPTHSAEDLRAKVRDVAALIRRADVTEAEKNAALRSILSHIVYDKPHSQLLLYFLP